MHDVSKSKRAVDIVLTLFSRSYTLRGSLTSWLALRLMLPHLFLTLASCLAWPLVI